MRVFLRPALSGCNRGLFCFGADNSGNVLFATSRRIYCISFFRGIIGHRSSVFPALLSPKKTRQCSGITNSFLGRVLRDSLSLAAKIHEAERIKHSPPRFLLFAMFSAKKGLDLMGVDGPRSLIFLHINCASRRDLIVLFLLYPYTEPFHQLSLRDRF